MSSCQLGLQTKLKFPIFENHAQNSIFGDSDEESRFRKIFKSIDSADSQLIPEKLV